MTERDRINAEQLMGLNVKACDYRDCEAEVAHLFSFTRRRDGLVIHRGACEEHYPGEGVIILRIEDWGHD